VSDAAVSFVQRDAYIVFSSVIAYSQKCSLVFVSLLMAHCVPKHVGDNVILKKQGVYNIVAYIVGF
jgi:hypothetical protein